jgi:hypothetical protein
VMRDRRKDEGDWQSSLVAWLVLVVLLGLGPKVMGPALYAGENSSGRPSSRLHVAVHQGQLSVDLWEAEVGEVLARIGHEAGVIITGSPPSGARVRAQFRDVELEAGLRRLLGRASLSYAIRYARDSTGAMAMQEVRVFGLAGEEPPAPLNAAARVGPDHTVRSRVGLPPSAD